MQYYAKSLLKRAFLRSNNYTYALLLKLLSCGLLLSCQPNNNSQITLRAHDIRSERIPASVNSQIQAELKVRQSESENKSLSGGRGPAFIGHDELTWKQDLITVSFASGPKEAHLLIEQAATKWIDPKSYVRFSFRDENDKFRIWDRNNTSSSTDIRISFESGEENGGYWSVLGELAISISKDYATMNLESFDTKLQPFYGGKNNWTDSYEHSTILHEFGHALVSSPNFMYHFDVRFLGLADACSGTDVALCDCTV